MMNAYGIPYNHNPHVATIATVAGRWANNHWLSAVENPWGYTG
jgi:hypothetical protein